MNASNIIILTTAFAWLFYIAEYLYHYWKLPAEVTRKIVHIGTGLLTLFFPVAFSSSLTVAILCSAFLLLLVASRELKLLPSINAVKRTTDGSWLYPIIVFVVFLYYRHMAWVPDRIATPRYYFYTPILTMALCDPIAAAVGSAWKRSHPQTAPGKTMAGSFAFFLAASVLIGLLATQSYKPALPEWVFLLTGLLLGFLATLAERFSGRGWDNFSIPAIIIIGMHAFELGLKSLL